MEPQTPAKQNGNTQAPIPTAPVYVVGEVYSFPVDLITVDKEFNSRRKLIKAGEKGAPANPSADDAPADPTTIEGLAKLIERDGQTTPVWVMPDVDNPGKFFLLAGFRRMSAIKLLGRETVQAKLFPATDKARALLSNMKENMQRANLTAYETAAACARVREYSGNKLTANEMSKELGGLSKSRINNYLRVLENVDSSVLKAWSDEHPEATVSTLEKLAGMKLPDGKPDHEKQKNTWKLIRDGEYIEESEAQAAGETTDAEETTETEVDGGSESTGPKPAGKAALAEALADVRQFQRDYPDTDKLYCEGLARALEFALGKRKRIALRKPDSEVKTK